MYRTVLSKEDERTCVMEEDATTVSDARDWEFDKISYGSEVDGNTQEVVFKDTSVLITSASDGLIVRILSQDFPDIVTLTNCYALCRFVHFHTDSKFV